VRLALVILSCALAACGAIADDQTSAPGLLEGNPTTAPKRGPQESEPVCLHGVAHSEECIMCAPAAVHDAGSGTTPPPDAAPPAPVGACVEDMASRCLALTEAACKARHPQGMQPTWFKGACSMHGAVGGCDRGDGVVWSYAFPGGYDQDPTGLPTASDVEAACTESGGTYAEVP